MPNIKSHVAFYADRADPEWHIQEILGAEQSTYTDPQKIAI